MSSLRANKRNCLIWDKLVNEAMDVIKREPHLEDFFRKAILGFEDIESSISYVLADQLQQNDCNLEKTQSIIFNALISESDIYEKIICDINTVIDRDPACITVYQPILFFKGFQSLQVYRAANYYWKIGNTATAFYLQSRASQVFDIDIHPAADIGMGVLMDHATGLVIGETSKVGNGTSILHGVTLGGTGTDNGDRHPKVGENVTISANVSILGNINIGDNVKIGAGSLVLEDLPAGCTAVGVPAKIIK
ncbi:serine O-acetyltransferase [Hyphomicrobiales bacterium]|jgi:serine O-acetyltransferase|nr:serine O-acetyltransferase [Hyphomicrobiales bacterium]MDA9035015.1 serine O-acetyltransferase [Hyphomicrobiales bacterium]MDA9904784.1 serine O-acetyltransferase [Hyphomicrobiales bacterium]MDB9926279.1 serine O-acetyltransferase [Hyphomicrobiales bacterium]|tara:strand:- start:937 stop:1686 length:750 start_codon:yes stop_codon:yes gene_type:complete